METKPLTTGQFFDINRMAAAIHLSPAEIKMRLGIPLDEVCEATETSIARQEYHKTPEGSEKRFAALKRWTELFLIDVEKAKLLVDVETLYFTSPPNPTAVMVAFRKIAFLCGFTEMPASHKLSDAVNLKQALSQGFSLLSPGEKVLGPKGKIILARNNVPLGYPGIMEIDVIDAHSSNEKRLFTAFFGPDEQEYNIQASCQGEKIEDWLNEW